jgi:hypothetical protein
MLTLYYALYKCLTGIGVLVLVSDAEHYTYASIVFFQAVLALLYRPPSSPGLAALRTELTAWPRSNIGLWPAFGLISLSMAILFWQIGVPTLADDPNVAKTMLQEHPLLIRWYRFFLPACIILMICAIRINSQLLNSKHLAFIGLGFLMGLMLGFKGFILTYVLIPLAIAVAGNFKLRVSRIILMGLFGVIVSVSLAAFIERLTANDAILFFATRITVVQALGPSQSLHEIENLHGYDVISHDLSTAMYRIGWEGGTAQSFNAYMFEQVMGENPYGMEVTVPFSLGFMIQFGFIGLVVASFIETVLAVLLFRKTDSIGARGNSPMVYTIMVLASMAYIDAALNGVLSIRVLDFLVSLLFFAPFIWLVKNSLMPKRMFTSFSASVPPTERC